MASFKSNIFGILMLVLIINAAAAADKYTSSEQLLKVKFELPLDVQTLDSDEYIAFQANLRSKLKGSEIGPQGNKVAVLPPDTATDPQWFDLKLTGAGGAQTTVRFRVGNLYVVGYQATTPKPTWFEFGNPNKGDTKHWIPGSQFLGFRGDYVDLERAAGKSLTQINLNRFNFEAAVKTLATSTKGDASVAAALIVVAQLMSEACRFVVLSNGLSTNLLSSQPVYLKEWMLNDLERKWGTYSEILFCYYTYPTYKFPKQTINGKEVATAEKLRQKLGILLHVQVDKTKCKITANDVELPDVIAFQALVQNPVELAGVEA